MTLAILVLLILSIVLNIVFYIKLSKANTKIKNLLETSDLDDTSQVWGKFERI